MRDNINKVAERGERLDSLESKTGALSNGRLHAYLDRQPRSLSTGIPTWCKPCSKADVVESTFPPVAGTND